jgi:hypothetical protein
MPASEGLSDAEWTKSRQRAVRDLVDAPDDLLAIEDDIIGGGEVDARMRVASVRSAALTDLVLLLCKKDVRVSFK